MQTQSMKIGENWTAVATGFDSGTDQNKSFLENCVWTVSDPAVLSITGLSGSFNANASLTAVSVGVANLVATSSGVTQTIEVTVNPPFDTIKVAFSRA